MGSILQPLPPSTVGELKQRLHDLQTPKLSHSRAVPTGIASIDSLLPDAGLAFGRAHEFLGVQDPHDSQTATRGRSAFWSPPLVILLELARCALHTSTPSRKAIAWIGPAVWPFISSFRRHPSAHSFLTLDHSLFIRACKPHDRLWAIDLALRSRAVPIVIADGSGFDLSATRRLQLAAEASGGLCLLARPPWERAELSAAATRWHIAFAPSPSMNRRWNVELLRCKGMRPSPHATTWTLEQDHASCALRLAADVLDRPRQTTPHSELRRAG